MTGRILWFFTFTEKDEPKQKEPGVRGCKGGGGARRESGSAKELGRREKDRGGGANEGGGEKGQRVKGGVSLYGMVDIWYIFSLC